MIIHSNTNQFILRCDTISSSTLDDSDRVLLKEQISHDIAEFLDKERFVLESVSRVRSE